VLLVARLVYTKLTAHMISTKLDEASVRYFVQARYNTSSWQLVRSFLEDNKIAILVFMILVIGAFAASFI
ncbi:MAG: hypothetical protein ACTMHG_03800, partial [Marinobacter sp.]